MKRQHGLGPVALHPPPKLSGRQQGVTKHHDVWRKHTNRLTFNKKGRLVPKRRLTSGPKHSGCCSIHSCRPVLLAATSEGQLGCVPILAEGGHGVGGQVRPLWSRLVSPDKTLEPELGDCTGGPYPLTRLFCALEDKQPFLKTT